MRKDIVRYFNQNNRICTELQTNWKISHSISTTKCVVLRKRIIEDSGLMRESSDILGRARKKFAFGIGSKYTPPLWFGENLFQIWNWFGSARFSVSLLVGSMFCFLCGNKTKSLHRLMLTLYSRYTLYKKVFPCGLTSWDSAVCFFLGDCAGDLIVEGFKFLLLLCY